MNRIIVSFVVALLFSITFCSASEIYDGTDQNAENPLTYTQEEWDEICYGTPEDVLNGSTEELLDFFYESGFLIFDLVGRSSPDVRVIDYSKHSAFAELLTRNDFLAVLVKKKDEVLSDPDSVLGLERINAIMSQPSVVELIQTSSADGVVEQKAPFYQEGTRDQFTLNNIIYTSSGSINTVNGNSVTVYTASREWTSNEQAVYDSSWPTLTPLYHASTRFNCHSYAWYKMSFSSNTYWIPQINQFVGDSACIPVSSSSIQVDDIIVYLDGTNIAHSGVVYSINGSNILICSKWGQAGIYIHSINNVPPIYLDHNTGMPNVVYYRYHGYNNQYIGQEYHSGSKHYYRFADVCMICGKSINFTWHSYPCSGPPCALLFRNRLMNMDVGFLVDYGNELSNIICFPYSGRNAQRITCRRSSRSKMPV